MKQVPLIDDGHEAKLERDREHEVDRTPGMVCRQGLVFGLSVIELLLGSVPSTMLDIGAGSGVFGQQLNAIAAMRAKGHFPLISEISPYTIAIEPRVEESPHLRRHYDQIHLRTFGAFMPCLGSGIPQCSWVASNPAFSIMPEIVRTCVPVCVAVLLYGSIAWGCSEQGAELFDEFRPYACGRVRGRVHHRGPGLNPKTNEPWGADQRDNCWWLWLRDERPSEWKTCNLPLLPSEHRRWTIPPGQEP